MVGVVGGGILELLKKAVNCRADFRSVGGLGFAAVGDVERIQRHGCLLRGAFVG